MANLLTSPASPKSVWWGTLLFFLAGLAGLGAQTAPLTLTLDAGTTVTTFIPLHVFGANAAYWLPKADYLAVQPLVQAAGNRFLRYPGGAQSDNYHWNGTGAFDASGHWVPDDTNYSGGFVGYLRYRGTTSLYTNWGIDWSSQAVDGDPSTAWMSNADTNFPGHQWVELDLTGKSSPGGTTQVSAVTIVWGNPSAASFQVQYWSGSNYPPPYMSTPESLWTTTSAGTVAGTGDGTTQGVTFNTVSTEYLRVLLTSSTAGAGGAYSIGEVYIYGPAGQVSRNTSGQTNNIPDQTWAAVSSTDPACTRINNPYFPDFNFEDFMSYCNSLSPPAVPLLTVNLGSGTPQEAAAWVHYANIVRGYGIKYWEVGNEHNGRWATGGPLNTADYVRRFIEYSDAMKAVDPTIRVLGPVTGGSLSEPSNLYDGRSILQDFIQMAAAAGVSLYGDANRYLDGIDFHSYFFWGSATPAQILNSTGGFGTLYGSLRGLLTGAGVTGVSNIPFLMSEFNSTSDDQNFTVQLGNGLFVAEALGRFITAFGPAGSCNFWAVMNGGSYSTNPAGGDLGYISQVNDGYRYQPRASYWAMKMMATDWALPGDANAHALVQTSINGAPATQLTAYSDYRPDGVLSLAVVNKDPVTAFNAVVDVGPFVANDTASGWTLDSSDYQWVATGAPPYHASPNNPPTAFAVTGTGASFPVTFRPYSVSVIQFTNSGQPTNTPQPTPTITATPTATFTPNYGPATLVDNFEDLSRDGVPPARTNLWNGAWSISVASNSGITVQYGVAGAAGTSHATSVYGTIGASPTPGWSNYTTSLAGQWPSTPFNLSGGGIVGLEFWFYGDGATYRVTVPSQAVADYDYYGVQITPPKDQWIFYQIPFAQMTRQGWGTQTGLPVTFGGSDCTGVQFSIQSAGAFSYRVDQVGFYTAAGASPTPTPVTSQSPTDTPFPEGSVPVIYPNPWRGQDPVEVQLWLQEAGPVQMRIFTTSFRKVADQTYPDLPAGPQKLELDLKDSRGNPLADGLYYVVVKAPTRSDTTKLLILR